MDQRQQRGMELAATRTITKKYGIWLVPSQAGTGVYKIDLSTKPPTCTCPDFKGGTARCKHIYAAHYAQMRKDTGTSRAANADKIIEEIEAKRQTYPQAWPAYNQAQTTEKDHFQALLSTLCRGVEEPTQVRRGRHSIPLSDALFSCVFKVYTTFSARRFMSDLRAAHERGHIGGALHYSSIYNYMESPALTPILKALIEQSARPLRTIDDVFAADSTGFMVCRFTRWFDHKYGKPRQDHDWVKCHIMCGVKTNVITAVDIADRDAGDAPFLPDFVDTTAQNFTIKEVTADKGYMSRKNVEAIEAVGGTPFIDVKARTTGAVGGAWERMVNYFKYRQDEFLEHYHQRSNVESTFSMIKRKFGDALRSKTDIAMVNESLCKLLCHNLVVLIHEMHELGIDPVDWGSYPAPKKGPASVPAVLPAQEVVANLLGPVEAQEAAPPDSTAGRNAGIHLV